LIVQNQSRVRFHPAGSNDPNVGIIRLDDDNVAIVMAGWGSVGNRQIRLLDDVTVGRDLTAGRDLIVNGQNRVKFHPAGSNDPNVGVIRLDDDNAALAVLGWGTVGNRKVRLRDDAEVSRNLLVSGSITTPSLTVNGRQVDGTNLYNSDGGLSSTRNVSMNSNNLIFGGEGRIGLGVANPKAKLHIWRDSDAFASNPSVKFIDANLGSAPSNQGDPYKVSIDTNWNFNGDQKLSIYAEGHIVTNYAIVSSTVINWSDERLKVIHGVSNASKDLDLLKRLKVTDYHMKDWITHGKSTQKKLIAQQVEKVFPNAVTRSTEIIPDIYETGLAINNRIKVAGTDKVKPGDLVRLMIQKDNHEEPLDLHVTGVDKESFTVQCKEPINGKVFVYGVQRNDVRGVEYEAIAMLNVSATQELARHNEQLTAQVKAQAAKLAAQEANIVTLNKSQMAEIASLKKQQAAEIAQIKAALEAMNKLVATKVTERAAKVVSTTAH
jgi:hypothetical protein